PENVMSAEKGPRSGSKIKTITGFVETDRRRHLGEASCPYLPACLSPELPMREVSPNRDPVRADRRGKWLWAASGTWSVTMGAA
ncbi:MAG: hypothetical protein VX938_00370, partial [Myxococcota bacterium]|nr:hypothetical protein [Myxococcota bacterium]